MKKKIRNILEKRKEKISEIGKIKRLVFIFIIIMYVNAINLALMDKIDFIFYYPEETYQKLEEEAKQIISTGDNNIGNNMKKFKLDKEIKYLEIELESDENDYSKTANLVAEVKNYGENNQSIQLIRRDKKEKNLYFLKQFSLFYIIMPILMEVVLVLILLILYIVEIVVLKIFLLILDIFKKS